MVTVFFSPGFERRVRRIKDKALKGRMKRQIAKLVSRPEAGKPMKYSRKGTREVYVAPFRLSYYYSKAEDKVVLLELYHKDEQ